MRWHRGMFFGVPDKESSVHYRSGNGVVSEMIEKN